MYDKLMIVAHPDDEILMSGILPNSDWTVVCLTCGDNPIRRSEFMSVAERLGFYGVIYDFKDCYGGWTIEETTAVVFMLAKIIESRNWSLVLSHGRDGEYGHAQHKQVGKILHELVPSYIELQEFGYGTCSNKERLDKALDIVKIYKSQEFCVNDAEVLKWLINAEPKRVERV